METRKAQVGELEAQLRQWDARLYELAGMADEASAEAKVGLRQRIDELKAQHRVLQARLLALRVPVGVRSDSFWASVRLERVRRHIQESDERGETSA